MSFHCFILHFLTDPNYPKELNYWQFSLNSPTQTQTIFNVSLTTQRPHIVEIAGRQGIFNSRIPQKGPHYLKSFINYTISLCIQHVTVQYNMQSRWLSIDVFDNSGGQWKSRRMGWGGGGGKTCTYFSKKLPGEKYGPKKHPKTNV